MIKNIIYIKLSQAKLCAELECSTIFTGNVCPCCLGEEFIFLSKILDREEN